MGCDPSAPSARRLDGGGWAKAVARRTPPPREPGLLLGSTNTIYQYPWKIFWWGPSAAAANADVPTVIEWPSADGRRTYTELLPVKPPSPLKRMREEAHERELVSMMVADDPPLPTFDAFELDLDSDRYHMDLGGVFDATPSMQRKPAKGIKKLTPSDKSLHEWRALHDEFLREVLRLEGPRDASEEFCPSCGTENPTIRCKQCFGGELFCVGCCVAMHAANPLHIINVSVLPLHCARRLLPFERRMVSSELRDPGLGTDWSYFVEQEPYHQYLLATTNETEVSTCSGLAALDYANTKFSRGYSTTGVGMGICARHEFLQPTGYSNINWIFAAILRWKHERLDKVISYDIICQWFKNLFQRLLKLPSMMYIHSHTLACQLLFSLIFLLGVGQTDGKGIERPWANLGGVATSTREMGPGSQRDTLDSHLGYWNWSKLIGIDLLCRRLDKAVVEEHEQTTAFESFTEEQKRGATEAEVHLKLSEEEAERAKQTPSLHDISPSGFIYGGLELEEQQCVETARSQCAAI
ncbi:hypothetical protein C8F04DRAFT_1273648 [Mycena alexandri]|uniref:CxC2-like cysteine cluster KDZ transposase-associated domain-containing protein n=1 Tax=Mycena alexandri TaxID=1745969 RepID=A0AAD6S5C9_9AGAR|nr:hypothetical protein C8F04DRAFT_1273648 [Mycena alexandri]